MRTIEYRGVDFTRHIALLVRPWKSDPSEERIVIQIYNTQKGTGILIGLSPAQIRSLHDQLAEKIAEMPSIEEGLIMVINS